MRSDLNWISLPFISCLPLPSTSLFSFLRNPFSHSSRLFFHSLLILSSPSLLSDIIPVFSRQLSHPLLSSPPPPPVLFSCLPSLRELSTNRSLDNLDCLGGPVGGSLFPRWDDEDFSQGGGCSTLGRSSCIGQVRGHLWWGWRGGGASLGSYNWRGSWAYLSIRLSFYFLLSDPLSYFELFLWQNSWDVQRKGVRCRKAQMGGWLRITSTPDSGTFNWTHFDFGVKYNISSPILHLSWFCSNEVEESIYTPLKNHLAHSTHSTCKSLKSFSRGPSFASKWEFALSNGQLLW